MMYPKIINKKFLLVLFPLSCLFIFSSFSSVEATHNKTTLTFNQPVDTQLSRSLIERLSKAYNAIGVELEIIQFEHIDALEAANAGQLDGQIGRIIDILGDYPNLLASQKPLLDLNLVLLTKKGECSPCDLNQLKSISHNSSYPFAQKYMLQMGYRGEIHSHSHLPSQLHLLKSDAIDGILVLQYQLKHQIDSERLKYFDEQIVSSRPIHHFLHKKHKHILEALDEHFAKNDWHSQGKSTF